MENNFEFGFIKNQIIKIAIDNCIGCGCEVFKDFPIHHSCTSSFKSKANYYFDEASDFFMKHYPFYKLNKTALYEVLINDTETSRMV